MIVKSSATRDAPLEILRLDPQFIAVEKPSGLLSVPGRGEDKADCVLARLLTLHPDALVVHRLDQPTSGILLFARSLAAQRALSDAFAQRKVAKRYEAIVEGALTESSGRIDLPLIADWPNRPRQKVDPIVGKSAVTEWVRLDDPALAALNRTRVSLHPVTGRSHQLRVHLQALGHPIVGDALYGPEDATMTEARLLLHAATLNFAHPVSGVPVQIRSEVPF